MLTLLFLGLPALSFPELFAGQTLFQGDLSGIHYPMHVLAAGEWLAGRAPLWNPYLDAGIPLLAEAQVSVLAPQSAIFLLPLPATLKLSLFVLLHFTLAGLFTLGLARELGLSWPAATVAGLSFGMGGFLMAQLANTNIMAGAALLPLVVWACVWALRRRSVPAAAVAGLSLGLQALTAQPQVVVFTVVVILGYACYRVAADGWMAGRQEGAGRKVVWAPGLLVPLLLVCVLLVFGVLSAAPQLLPTLELQQLSLRGGGLAPDVLMADSLPPLEYLNLAFPGLFGNNVTGYAGQGYFTESFAYGGLLALVLAGFAWGQRRRRDAPFFFVLLVAAVLLTLGRFTPVYGLILRTVPGFNLFRVPSRWLMVVSLALAMLAGCGLETLLTCAPKWRRVAPAVAVAAVLALGLGLVWLYREPLSVWAADPAQNLGQHLVRMCVNKGFAIDGAAAEGVSVRRLIPWLNVPALLWAVNLSLAAGLLGAYAGRLLPSRVFGWVVAAALAFDLTVAGGTAVHVVWPSAMMDHLSGGARYVLEHLSEGRFFPTPTTHGRVITRNLGQSMPSAYRVRSAGGYLSPLTLARKATLRDEADQELLARLYDVRYLLLEERLAPEAETVLSLEYDDGESAVYAYPSPLPRAYVVHRAVAVPDGAAAFDLVRSMAVDPAQAVVVESREPLPDLPATVDSGDDLVEIEADEPQRVSVRVHQEQPGFLVLLDTYYPGWAAAIDGRPGTILQADYAVRAVYVPAGDHTVAFVYRPVSFYAGVALAVVALAAVLLLNVLRFPKS